LAVASPQTPLGELTMLPHTLLDLKGATSQQTKGEEGTGARLGVLQCMAYRVRSGRGLCSFTVRGLGLCPQKNFEL